MEEQWADFKRDAGRPSEEQTPPLHSPDLNGTMTTILSKPFTMRWLRVDRRRRISNLSEVWVGRYINWPIASIGPHMEPELVSTYGTFCLKSIELVSLLRGTSLHFKLNLENHQLMLFIMPACRSRSISNVFKRSLDNDF
jgi:hypothetical protein